MAFQLQFRATRHVASRREFFNEFIQQFRYGVVRLTKKLFSKLQFYSVKLRRRHCFQFPHGGRKKGKKINTEEIKIKTKFVRRPFPSLATRVIDRTVVDNLSQASGTRSGSFLSGRVARKSDNPICGRRDFRPREPTSAVTYEDTLMLPHRGFTSYMLMNNLVTNSVPPRFSPPHAGADNNDPTQNSRICARTFPCN